jgi:hypothetical protein
VTGAKWAFGVENLASEVLTVKPSGITHHHGYEITIDISYTNVFHVIPILPALNRPLVQVRISCFLGVRLEYCVDWMTTIYHALSGGSYISHGVSYATPLVWRHAWIAASSPGNLKQRVVVVFNKGSQRGV